MDALGGRLVAPPGNEERGAMIRARHNQLAVRALALGLLAAFAFGSASGPLRTCLAHPGHGSGSHGASEHLTQDASHAGHAAYHADTDGTRAEHDMPSNGHEGCSCLGRCSIEQAPGLSGIGVAAVAYSSAVPKALPAPAVRAHKGREPFSLPLARPPPAVV
jgi:hypothetical protein